jgi:hypothetical protein
MKDRFGLSVFYLTSKNKQNLEEFVAQRVAEICKCSELPCYLSSEMSKGWKITLGLLAGITVVLTIIWLSPLGRFILKGGLGELNDQPFDSVQWKDVRNGTVKAKRVRFMMMEDLMENKLKTGMDSLTVKEILGEPERQFGFSYDLGALAEGMDPFYLVVDFDSVGTVRRFNVTNEAKLKGEPGSLKIQITDEADSL